MPHRTCVFPFEFNNVIYNNCTREGSEPPDCIPWCSTSVNEKGQHIGELENWRNCTTLCTAERMQAANAPETTTAIQPTKTTTTTKTRKPKTTARAIPTQSILNSSTPNTEDSIILKLTSSNDLSQVLNPGSSGKNIITVFVTGCAPGTDQNYIHPGRKKRETASFGIIQILLNDISVQNIYRLFLLLLNNWNVIL